MKCIVFEYSEDGWDCVSHQIINPSWMEVESAVRALDRFRHPFVWFYWKDSADEGEVPDFEIIGGEGVYCIAGIEDDQKRIIFNAEQGEDHIAIWESDQGAEVPAKNVCNDFDTVLNATRYFFHEGRLDPRLNWTTRD